MWFLFGFVILFVAGWCFAAFNYLAKLHAELSVELVVTVYAILAVIVCHGF